MKQKFDLHMAERSLATITSARVLAASFDQNESVAATNLDALIKEFGELFEQTGRHPSYAAFDLASAALKALRSRIKIERMAHDGDGDLASERERFRILWRGLATKLSGMACSDKAVLETAFAVSHEDVDARAVADVLIRIPIATTYFWIPPEPERGQSRSAAREKVRDSVVLVKLAAKLDGHPLVSAQMIRPQILFPLAFDIVLLEWDANFESLSLDVVTSCPSDEYTISKFTDIVPTNNGNKFHAQTTGHIKFSTAQSLKAEPLSFAVRCAVRRKDGTRLEVPSIGNNQLAFRVLAETSRPSQAKYKRLADHVSTLLEELCVSTPAVMPELDTLVPVLDALTDFLGVHSQSATFKGRASVKESEFQKVVVHDMRFSLGPDVTEHAAQGGGFTDVRFRGVIVELKTEAQNGDRAHICDTYKSQPIQYASAEARQVAVVLVLDTTKKAAAPSDIRNDVLLVDVPTHGGSDIQKKFPSKAIVFVLNANQVSPSDYSR